MSRRSIFPSSAHCEVYRDRLDDRPCPKCGSIVATHGASAAMHEAGLICICKHFIGWLGAWPTDATLCEAAVGAEQPISLNHIEEEIIMASATQSSSNDNRAALFANKYFTEGSNKPNYTGKGMCNGVPIELAGWSKVAKNGAKFMSISFKPTEGIRFTATSTSS
jgi:hypothetical protein